MGFAKWSAAALLFSVMLWALWIYFDPISSTLNAYVENGDFITLEARFTQEEILEAQRNVLLGGNTRSYKGISTKYLPYLLLEVKYTGQDKKTREGMVLWSLFDGEILLNTETGQRTHGYFDAISNNATGNDYRILQSLSRSGGVLAIDQLQRELRLEEEAVENWIASARTKHLITQKGNILQLHFQNPKLVVTPQSTIVQRVVTKPYSQADWLPKKFTRSQIEVSAKAAFGNDFSVRAAQEIYLPVFSIEVQNPDGSTLTSYWNPLNGQQISQGYLGYR
ncbi:MAG: hypothetical protein WC222_12465 [Parachlamydiales bacterium]|jgi:hypothetical protein